MTRLQAVPETPHDAAMGWLLRRDARPLSADEREAFQTWLETPQNREAYAALETLCEFGISARERQETADGDYAWFDDPEGNRVELWQQS